MSTRIANDGTGRLPLSRAPGGGRARAPPRTHCGSVFCAVPMLGISIKAAKMLLCPSETAFWLPASIAPLKWERKGSRSLGGEGRPGEARPVAVGDETAGR